MITQVEESDKETASFNDFMEAVFLPGSFWIFPAISIGFLMERSGKSWNPGQSHSIESDKNSSEVVGILGIGFQQEVARISGF